jgi:hypothetical protein
VNQAIGARPGKLCRLSPICLSYRQRFVKTPR